MSLAEKVVLQRHTGKPWEYRIYVQGVLGAVEAYGYPGSRVFLRLHKPNHSEGGTLCSIYKITSCLHKTRKLSEKFGSVGELSAQIPSLLEDLRSIYFQELAGKCLVE